MAHQAVIPPTSRLSCVFPASFWCVSGSETVTMPRFTESVVEEAALAWLESAGWQIAHGPDIAPDMPAAERRGDGGGGLGGRPRGGLWWVKPPGPAPGPHGYLPKPHPP